MYKFINPGNSKGVATIGARSSLLAVNRLGSTVSGLGSTVNNLEKIYKLSAKNEKLVEIAERRAKKREQDRLREEEIEGQNLLKGKFPDKTKRKAKEAGKKRGLSDKIMDGLFGGAEGILLGIFQFIAKLYTLFAVKTILTLLQDPANIKKTQKFIDSLTYVFGRLFKFGKLLLYDGIYKPFDQMVNGGDFKEKMAGLGKLILGLSALTILTNPLGTMDSILRLLNLDFYRDKSPLTNKGNNLPGSGTGSGSGVNPNAKSTLKGKNLAKTRAAEFNKKFGTNAKNHFNKKVQANLGKGQSYSQAIRNATNSTNQLIKSGKFKPVVPKNIVTPKPNIPSLQNVTKGVVGKFTRAGVKAKLKSMSNKVPWMGGLFTAIFSMLDEDPISLTLFKTIGSLLGGAVGGAVPVPVLNFFTSALGLAIGEYVGEILHMGFMGEGGWQSAGKKAKEDIAALWNNIQNIGIGFARLYEGIPKVTIGKFKTVIPDVSFFLDPNAQRGQIFADAFFGQGLMREGQVSVPKTIEVKNKRGRTVKVIPNPAYEGGANEYNDAVSQAFRDTLVQRRRAGVEYEIGDVILEKVKGGERILKKTATGWVDIQTVGGLTRSNFASDFAYKVFMAGGGNNALKQGITLQEVLELGGSALKEQGIDLARASLEEKESKNKNILSPTFGNEELENIDYEDTGGFGPIPFDLSLEHGAMNYSRSYEASSVQTDSKNRVEYKEDGLESTGYTLTATDINRIKNSVPEGSFGIGSKHTDDFTSRHSTGYSGDQPKKEEPKYRTNRRGRRVRIREYGGPLPEFFFGRIFRGITKAVSGVVSGIGKAVGGVVSAVGKVAQVAAPILSIAAPFIPALAPIMPFMQAAQAVQAVASGDIVGGIMGGLGAMGSFFPKTFGAESAFGKFMSGPIGSGITGFMQGGIQGALGSLTSFLPQGFQNFMGNVQGFMGKFPSIGGLLNGIPGVGNILGAFGIGGGMGESFSPISLFGDIANNMGFGSIFKTVTGLMQGGGMESVMQGLREMAPELGVKPEALGIFTAKGRNARTNLLDPRQSEMSKAYAMQNQIEPIPTPIILNKLVAIKVAVPVGGG